MKNSVLIPDPSIYSNVLGRFDPRVSKSMNQTAQKSYHKFLGASIGSVSSFFFLYHLKALPYNRPPKCDFDPLM